MRDEHSLTKELYGKLKEKFMDISSKTVVKKMSQTMQKKSERRFVLYRRFSRKRPKETEQRRNLHHQVQHNHTKGMKYFRRNGTKKRSRK